MGSIASNYADNIIITDDNPRYEDAKLIRYQIIKSCPNSIEIADRLKAIAMAINNLKKGDVLLVAGKGHESTQEIKGKFFDFNDAKIIKKLLARS
jgi:UDP-N-acetylmuramoyl-L-alanyl-D-glutamate--2,6-diaminopimelate ligase